MQEKRASWLQEALIKLDLMTDAVYQQQISTFFDEQPYLMGFLFNLEDEFSENTHELLMRASLAFYQAMTSMGLEFEVATPSMLEGAIAQKVEFFNQLDKDDDSFDESALFNEISSPQAVKGLLKFIDGNTSKVEFEQGERNNVLLMLSAIVDVLEAAAILPDQKHAS